MILTAYFSQKGETYMNRKIVVVDKGNTQIIAERIAMKIETTLFHIEKEGGYPTTYNGMVEIAKEEWHQNARPDVNGKIENMDQYDTIILGYPSWCGTMPKVVCTFLESYDLTNKRIIPYCTNEGSGLGSSIKDLQQLLPHCQILPGTSIHGAEASVVTTEIERIINLALRGNECSDILSNND